MTAVEWVAHLAGVLLGSLAGRVYDLIERLLRRNP